MRELERIIGYEFADYFIDKNFYHDDRYMCITDIEKKNIDCIINSVWSARYDIESDIENLRFRGEYIDIYQELCKEGFLLSYPFFEYGIAK